MIKLDNIRVGKKHDRRIKLTDEQRHNIKIEYEQGDTSQRKLAIKYGVSRSLIQMILNPKRAERVRKLAKERRKDGRYYCKDKHREAMREHREYKKQLLNKGKIHLPVSNNKPNDD